MRGPGNIAITKAGSDLGELLHQRLPTLYRLTLCRRPSPQLTVTRARRKVRIGFFLTGALDGATDRHLPVKFIPREQHRGLITLIERSRFAALVVGVEHQAVGIDALHQYHSLAQPLVGLLGGQHAGSGICKTGRNRLLLPRHKLRDGLLREVCPAEATQRVLTSVIAETHRISKGQKVWKV